MSNRPNVGRMMDVLSAILSEKYGCKVTLRATPKKTAENAEQKAG